MTATIERQVGEGKKVPDFSLPATGDQTLSLKDFKGQNIVLYFYPRDNTPGCTIESCAFQKLKSKFSKLNTVILGVSRDNLRSHDRFREKQGLKFDLLADTEETLCDLFDIMRDKNMYGKKVRGIERSTFYIDEKGKLIKEWRKVKAEGHAEEVYDYVKSL